MKKLFGFFVLVILLVAVSGCAQLQPAPATTPQTTVPTTVETPVATMEPTLVPTAAGTPIAPAVTAVATRETTLQVITNVTESVPTIAATPHVSLTPQTKITVFSMTNNTFTPKELTVLPGTGITWRNDDTVNHVVKGTTEAGTTMFKSSDIIPGASFSYTFGDRVGTFTVIDPGYPQMKCVIIVKDGQNFSGTI
ncbi:hypothetical protein [Methanoregula sp.]|uniref:cupredoxin domain-containing protein n=1 Tax=Methanoregula sp. TaxID=2052170 RepID=UPI0035681ECB